MDVTSFGTWPIAFVLILTRVSSFIVAGPLLGAGVVPNLVKVGFCVALSVFLAPNYMTYASEMQSAGIVVVALAGEALVGFILGYWLRLIFLPIKMAGTYVGQEMGFSLGQVTEPMSGNPSSEVGLMFDAIGLVLFWITDSHHETLKALAYSTQFPESAGITPPAPQEVAAWIGQAQSAGFEIVAPLGSVLFVVLVGLMVLMRAWPQINLFSFGTAARLLAGWVAFLVTGPFIIARISIVLRVGVQTLNAAMTG